MPYLGGGNGRGKAQQESRTVQCMAVRCVACRGVQPVHAVTEAWLLAHGDTSPTHFGPWQ